MEIPSQQEVGSALAHLGNWRVIHVQEAMYPYKPIPASVMLALGFRETGLRNICGGAKLEGNVWVQSYSDRGWLQITDTVEQHAQWLSEQEGCTNGYWTPSEPPVSALEAMHCPRFSPALDFTKASMLKDMAYAKQQGVASGMVLRFGIAAHNAGAGGALRGYHEGSIDKYTAQGDYSAYVLAVAPLVHNWIVAHPNWAYHGT